MKQIDTLVDDIYALFGSQKEFNLEIAKKFGELMSDTVASRVPAVNGGGTLRMSNLGRPCERKLWYEVNTPDEGEPLTPQTRFKFLYGDVLEELVLYLAAEAGHSVEGVQDEMEINGIKGHRDAVIDGVLVDVKSASSYSFRKFEKGLKLEDDKFGYITQLQQYLYASQDDPLVTDKNRAAFLVVDKTLGKLCLDIHERDGKDYSEFAEYKRNLVNSPVEPPRAFDPEPDGMSGNQKLGVNCSYCDFKKKCWPGLRTFLYGNGPRFLTRVAKTPNVPEV
jgi:CRISPR/Cas system-associated exonuclease Cas4 (RecB family)